MSEVPDHVPAEFMGEPSKTPRSPRPRRKREAKASKPKREQVYWKFELDFSLRQDGTAGYRWIARRYVADAKHRGLMIPTHYFEPTATLKACEQDMIDELMDHFEVALRACGDMPPQKEDGG